MPLITARLATSPSDDVTAMAVKLLTDLTVGVLDKEKPRTTVVVEYVPRAQWWRGGSQGGFFVQAKITAGTNSPAEKALYVSRAGEALEALLGISGYVEVDEIDAGSWGHGGETQSARYAAFAGRKAN